MSGGGGVLQGAGLACALALLAGPALGAWAGGLHPLLDLAGQFAEPAALAAVALAGAALVLGHRVAAVLALILAVLAGTAVSPARGLGACATGPAHARVVFANLWVRNTQVEAQVLPFLRASGADLVVLTEVTLEAYQALTTLDDLYPHMTPCPGPWRCGIVVLGRQRLRDVTDTLPHGGAGPSRRLVTAGTGRGPLTVMGVHVTQPWPFEPMGAQLRQAQLLADTLAARPPDLLVGDFNAVPWGAVMDRLRAAAPLTPAMGPGTWPASLPAIARLPIDNALAGSRIACATRTVGPTIGSDHRPIIVDLRWRETPPGSLSAAPGGGWEP